MKRISLVVSLVLFASILLHNGCAGSDEPEKIDCSASGLAVTIESTNPESCAVLNGSIIATATGGKGPYTFALNTGAFGQTSTFNGLSAGDFVIRVKDKNGCTVNSDEIELRIPGSNLSASATTEADTECINNNGSITVTASGGTEPYQFRLGNGSFGTNTTFSALAPGSYTVTVKDDGGCLFPRVVTVSRGDTETSLTNEIMPIIEANCAVTDCHNGSEDPNLSSPANVRTHANKIKQLTQSGEMPKEGSLSAAQKALIACWVDDGAKDN